MSLNYGITLILRSYLLFLGNCFLRVFFLFFAYFPIEYESFLNRSTWPIALFNRAIILMGRVFANSPRELGSILGRVIPNSQKCYLMPPCLTLSIIRYKSSVKWNNPRNGVASSPTPLCSSYWKRSLRVALEYSRELYFSCFAHQWNSNRLLSLLVKMNQELMTMKMYSILPRPPEV